MSNTQLIIPERPRDIGSFLVGRLLPFRKKRMVGPFVFIDHMGPSDLGPGRFLEVDQHPHIGLATLTYLLQGEIVHRDSLGTVQLIRPGSVNWMVAGGGVTHTERSPEELRKQAGYTLHGFQIWVALPQEHEQGPASFHHFAATDLPQWREEGLEYKLIAGEAFGRKAPVPVHSPLFMLELKVDQTHTLDSYGNMKGEIGIFVVKGRVESLGSEVEAGFLMVTKEEEACQINISAGSHLLIFGGQPLPEPRHIYWNFVASEKEIIEKAKERWKNRQFPAVPDDDSYVPLPES